jgi:hypothetical protein
MQLSKETTFFINIKWLKSICENLYVVVIYYKMQIYSKNIQIIAKLDEILNHILNMNWLYHFNYNWKFWLMWFHKKKYAQVFHSNEHIKCIEKINFVKNLFSFERWQELCWRPLYQNPFNMFIKMLDEIKEKLPPKSFFSCLKRPPPSVFSPMTRCINIHDFDPKPTHDFNKHDED